MVGIDQRRRIGCVKLSLRAIAKQSRIDWDCFVTPFLAMTLCLIHLYLQSSSGVKATTSSMDGASKKTITRRSIPRAAPAEGGISFNSSRNFSGIA